MKRPTVSIGLLFVSVLLARPEVRIGSVTVADEPAPAKSFQVGFAKREITPPPGLPMWGYGARHDKPAEGAIAPMFAKAVVIHAGAEKLALVGLDLGRGPTTPMMANIRHAIADKARIKHVLISGSHTHHGPVIELTDREGFGKGKFDKAIAYSQKLPDLIIDAILEADRSAQPSRIGIATQDVTLNRNRHTKRTPKPTDPMLAVLRFDDVSGNPVAVLVNFAAHPTMTNERILKYSPDYPGFMQRQVENELKTNCLFMQGAAGDMSTNPGQYGGPERFGEHLGELVVALARSAKTERPLKPSIKGRTDEFLFRSRTDFSNPLVGLAYGRAFFPEIGRVFIEELRNGVPVELNTVLLNGQIALVGGSGEFFCNHAVRLKQRSYVPHTLFFGYCNGHSLYIPTIEGVSEGGYGADATMSQVEIGAGEQIMNRALINIYTMLGKFPIQK